VLRAETDEPGPRETAEAEQCSSQLTGWDCPSDKFRAVEAEVPAKFVRSPYSDTVPGKFRPETVRSWRYFPSA